MHGWAQTSRVLFVTHSAGFRHDSIAVARQVLGQLDPARLRVTSTEDLSAISAASLENYEAVFFFTSGELALSTAQKQELLAWVAAGHGFGGAHSATDTLYTWPEYGALIGAWFDGHPWTQRVTVDIEDPGHPLSSHLAPRFQILEEIYQHRNFDRNNVRVLMTLDPASVDERAEGVNRKDRDFALAWTRAHGRGRVFYTALGHFDETWRDAGFQTTLRQALLWLTGQLEAEAAPRGGSAGPQPAIASHGGLASPNAILTLFGERLTSGSTVSGPAQRLAGTYAYLNNVPLTLFYASPGQVNLLLPPVIPANPELKLVSGIRESVVAPLQKVDSAPIIYAITQAPGAFVIWASGLGTLGADSRTVLAPTVTAAGVELCILYSGAAPGFPGLYQVNVVRPAEFALPAEFRLEMAGRSASFTLRE